MGPSKSMPEAVDASKGRTANRESDASLMAGSPGFRIGLKEPVRDATDESIAITLQQDADPADGSSGVLRRWEANFFARFGNGQIVLAREPGTGTLRALGLLGLARTRRRRRSSSG